MRLCTIQLDGAEQAAVLVRGRVLPVEWINRSTGASFPTSLLEVITEGLGPSLAAAVASLPDNGQGLAEDAVQVGPPYRTPPKLWGIGLNYREHAGDLGVEQPEEPGSYMRPNTCIIGPGDSILLPYQSHRVTAEAELALIIGRRCKNLSRSEAGSVIFGYTTVLDMTAEDMIRRNPRFIPRAKAFDTFCSVGPWVVTADEVADLPSLRVSTIHNGRVHATNVVANMRFDPHWLVHFHSHVMTLEPGDIICTGTPGAVVVEDGDVVEAEVTSVGRLINHVRRN